MDDEWQLYISMNLIDTHQHKLWIPLRQMIQMLEEEETIVDRLTIAMSMMIMNRFIPFDDLHQHIVVTNINTMYSDDKRIRMLRFILPRLLVMVLLDAVGSRLNSGTGIRLK